eukprot:CAMPEP_0119008230 /NCGR_PEP_ID=MMETSP1176-20130426/3548_1 /TAXON_ID=265551 /ORGANISM="Synedropsis recta cf, Strain CCMP1620" /LENGTH=343 /DNA_ID=CAMNT_0006960523 /DNA_START=109 /DNA_END=1140 /DNA_ORIENTATION=-
MVATKRVGKQRKAVPVLSVVFCLGVVGVLFRSSPSSIDGAGSVVGRLFGMPTTAAAVGKAEKCYEKYLPAWVRGDPETMANAFMVGSKELSDKYDNGHRFFYAYQPYLAKMVIDKLENSKVCEPGFSGPKPRIKFFEIGLGCHFKFGGMKQGTPGGSAIGWRAVFEQLAPVLDFELHLMEFDSKCALAWHAEHKEIAHMHTGDAASEEDLARIVKETNSSHDFDVIIDDASHINWHMIKTLEILMEQIQLGGIYVVEDLWSSCKSWGANFGTVRGEKTGGTPDCMVSQKGGPTFYAKLVEWQKTLLKKDVPFPDVNHIDFHGQIVVFEKARPQRENVWRGKSS